MKNAVKIHEVDPRLNSRRNFLKIGGLTAVGTGLLLAGCSEESMTDASMEKRGKGGPFPGMKGGKFDMGAHDIGVLTYAYALEQLEADFYTKVVNSTGFTSNFTAEDQQVLTDIYKHEVIHREFFEAVLTSLLPNPANMLLPDLQFDYGMLNFSSRDQVLATAKALEDTGVAAYNGAGRLLDNPTYLLLAGKIVSVEARHASAVRSLINPNSKDFAGDDVVDPNTGLDVAKNPSEILAIADGFITTQLSANYLP